MQNGDLVIFKVNPKYSTHMFLEKMKQFEKAAIGVVFEVKHFSAISASLHVHSKTSLEKLNQTIEDWNFNLNTPFNIRTENLIPYKIEKIKLKDLVN